MNRGVDRDEVFRTGRDARTFLDAVGEACRRTTVEVHGYCLMPNHFHLLVRCPDGGLSPFMQMMLGPFTQTVNARNGRDGPLFRGRFHSVLLSTPDHVDNAERYIHRNPSDRTPAVERYPWSSLAAYVGNAAPPAWLSTSWVAARYESAASHLEAVSAGLAPGWGQTPSRSDPAETRRVAGVRPLRGRTP